MANNGVPVPIFQSTLSMRRATRVDGTVVSIGIFQSTLSMRRATPVRSTAIGRTDFNPRSP